VKILNVDLVVLSIILVTSSNPSYIMLFYGLFLSISILKFILFLILASILYSYFIFNLRDIFFTYFGSIGFVFKNGFN